MKFVLSYKKTPQPFVRLFAEEKKNLFNEKITFMLV